MKYSKILTFILLIILVINGTLQYIYDQTIDIFIIIEIILLIMILTFKDLPQESKSYAQADAN